MNMNDYKPYYYDWCVRVVPHSDGWAIIREPRVESDNYKTHEIGVHRMKIIAIFHAYKHGRFLKKMLGYDTDIIIHNKKGRVIERITIFNGLNK